MTPGDGSGRRHAQGAGFDHGSATTDAPTAASIDLDRLEAILELQVEEVAYESALRGVARTLPDSLVHFLR